MKKRKGSSSNSYGDMINCTPTELFLQKNIEEIRHFLLEYS